MAGEDKPPRNLEGGLGRASCTHYARAHHGVRRFCLAVGERRYLDQTAWQRWDAWLAERAKQNGRQTESKCPR
jgi:hypothetical protein